MPDSSHAGRRYAAPGQVVDPERVRRFAAAVAGDDDVASDLGSVPPTYAAVYCLFPTLGRLFDDAELGVRLEGTVHAEQEFTWHAPVGPGDVLDAAATIASVESKRGRTFLTLDLECSRPATGDTVLTGRTLLLLAEGASR